jgi:small subunit ribosomal protein S18
MARNNDRDHGRGSKRVLKDNRPRGKKKVCIFCQDHSTWVDYKDVNLLRRFLSDRGKIRSSRVTGNCAQHQRDVQVAIKTARELALLPYAQRTVSERGPGRGPRGSRPEEGEPRGRSPRHIEDSDSADLGGGKNLEHDGAEADARGVDGVQIEASRRYEADELAGSEA